MGSAAPALADLVSDPGPEIQLDRRRETRPDPGSARDVDAESLRDAVLVALAQQPMLVSMLETAQWSLDGNTLTAKIASSLALIDMSFTSDARRVATAAASGLAARPIRMQVLPGGTAQSPAPRPANGTARSRAEQDPVVRRMQQKFGAEIRTVIDYREKG